jgi:hypothetical protein
MMDIPDNVDRALAFLAILSGTIWGHRHDPVTWLLLLVCVTLGALRWRAYTPLIAVAVATSFTVFSWGWKFGIAEQWHSIWVFIAQLVLGYAAYGIGHLIAALFQRPRHERG